MAFKLRKSAKESIRLPLACDPAMIEANSKDALKHYLETRDPAGLNIPADATHVVVRPLTAYERASVAEKVGASGQAAGFGAVLAYARAALPLAVERVEVEGESMPIEALLDDLADDLAIIEVIGELVGLVSHMNTLSNEGKA